VVDSADFSVVNDKPQCNKMLRAARARAEERGLAFTAPELFRLDGDAVVSAPSCEANPAGDTGERFALAKTRADVACPMPWTFVSIDMHGYVAPCGWWHGVEQLGRLVGNGSFRDIWEGEAYERLRTSLATGRRVLPVCQRCPAAGMGSVDSEAAFAERPT
jgi:MoaA/NifB/PqqE/SkfB family radical SAM enzyme